MNKTEKTAFREAIIVVLMGAVINFPLQTFLLCIINVVLVKSFIYFNIYSVSTNICCTN